MQKRHERAFAFRMDLRITLWILFTRQCGAALSPGALLSRSPAPMTGKSKQKLTGADGRTTHNSAGSCHFSPTARVCLQTERLLGIDFCCDNVSNPISGQLEQQQEI